jgi:hypothetical protein
MDRRTLLIGAILLFLTGCFSYTRPLAYTNTTINDSKQGQDCRLLILGIGGHGPDVTMAKAIRLGRLTKLRSAEYSVSTVEGIGNECVVVHGE